MRTLCPDVSALDVPQRIAPRPEAPSPSSFTWRTGSPSVALDEHATPAHRRVKDQASERAVSSLGDTDQAAWQVSLTRVFPAVELRLEMLRGSCAASRTLTGTSGALLATCCWCW